MANPTSRGEPKDAPYDVNAVKQKRNKTAIEQYYGNDNSVARHMSA